MGTTLVGAATGAVVTAAVVLLVLVLVFVLFRDRWGGRSAAGRATTDRPPDAAILSAVRAAESELRATVVVQEPERVELRVPVSWRSWGERVVVAAERPSGPGGWTEVTVDSSSRLRTTLLDWGRNRSNVDVVLRAVSGGVPGRD